MSRHKTKINEGFIEKDNGFTTKYGASSNALKPKVIYIQTKAKVTPFLEKDSYQNDVESIKRKFSDYVKKFITADKKLENVYIFNMWLSERSVCFGRPSFLKYELFFKPIKREPMVSCVRYLKKVSIHLDNQMEKILKKNGVLVDLTIRKNTPKGMTVGGGLA